MYSVTVSTTIARPIEEVYDFLDDLANHEAFCDHFMADWRFTREDTRGVGAGVRARGTNPGPKTELEISVFEAERPHRIAERGHGGFRGEMRSQGTYTLARTADGGTDVRFELKVEHTSHLARAMSVLGEKAYLRKANQKAMARLKELLESTQPAAGRAAQAVAANGA